MARPKKNIEWPPKKLPKDFPLTVHVRGYVKSGMGWIAGKVSPAEALAIYHEKAAAKLDNKSVAPVKIRHEGDDQTVDELSERWLIDKKSETDAGTMTLGHYVQCGKAVESFAAHVVGKDVPAIGGRVIGEETIRDLTPDHFADFGRGCIKLKGVKYARRTARLIMAMFNQADGEDWIDRPIKFGKRFRKIASAQGDPVRKTVPTAAQIRAVLAHLETKLIELRSGFARDLMPVMRLRAAILMGVNGGYGATDLSELPLEVIDLENAIIDYRRGKTKQERVVPLMPETVDALRPLVEHAKANKHAHPFRTREGKPLVWQVAKRDVSGEITSMTYIDSLNNAYGKVLRTLGFKVKGSGFYKIKDLHITHADEFGNDRAARLLTGHASAEKARDGRASYGVVTDEKLRALVEHIRQSVLVADDDEKLPAVQTISRASKASAPRRPAKRKTRGGKSPSSGSSSQRRGSSR